MRVVEDTAAYRNHYEELTRSRASDCAEEAFMIDKWFCISDLLRVPPRIEWFARVS